MIKRKNIRVPRLYKITDVNYQHGDEKSRIRYLRAVVDLGENALTAKEMFDYLLDSEEDVILSELREAKNQQELLLVQMRYRSILNLNARLTNLIESAKLKENAIRKISINKE